MDVDLVVGPAGWAARAELLQRISAVAGDPRQPRGCTSPMGPKPLTSGVST